MCISGIALSYIGIPLFIFLLLLEFISLGMVTYFIFSNFLLKGLLFSLIYILIFKLVYWFLLILNGFYSLKLIKNNYKYLFRRYRENKNDSKLYFKKMLIISSIVICFNLLSVTFGNKLINYLASYLLF